MLKKRQNEVKRNIFLFDEVKKNIAGQILKYNPSNWMKDRPNEPDQQFNWTLPANKTKSQKLLKAIHGSFQNTH